MAAPIYDNYPLSSSLEHHIVSHLTVGNIYQNVKPLGSQQTTQEKC